MDKFRFGIMGAGGIAGSFKKAVDLMEDCEVTAVASKSMERAEQFASAHGIEKAYDSYELLLQTENLDAVYIAVTPNAHFELSMLCLKYRVPVLCEKAMFRSSEEAQAVFDISRRDNIFTMEALWSRFLPANKKAKEWMEGGKIGKPSYLNCNIGFSAEQTVESRLFNPELSGGAAYDLTCYTYQLATFFFGSAYEASSAYGVWGEIDVDYSDQVTLIYKDKIASLHSSLVSVFTEDTTISGDKGRIVIPHAHTANEAFLYSKEGELLLHYKDEETKHGFIYEIEEVIRCVRDRQCESKVVPHIDTFRCAKIFDKLAEDKMRGEWVRSE